MLEMSEGTALQYSGHINLLLVRNLFTVARLHINYSNLSFNFVLFNVISPDKNHFNLTSWVLIQIILN
jgi:hypothetical protein